MLLTQCNLRKENNSLYSADRKIAGSIRIWIKKDDHYLIYKLVWLKVIISNLKLVYVQAIMVKILCSRKSNHFYLIAYNCIACVTLFNVNGYILHMGSSQSLCFHFGLAFPPSNQLHEC